MIDVKVNLTVLLPGSTMVSKQECFKQLKEEVKDKKGHVVKDKRGNIKYKYRSVPDPDKHNIHHLKVSDSKKEEIIHFYTRKCVPAKQVINISTIAYKDFIGNSAPEAFYAPAGFQPYMSVKKMALRDQAWNVLTEEQKIKWHCERIAASLGGSVEDYAIFPD